MKIKKHAVALSILSVLLLLLLALFCMNLLAANGEYDGLFFATSALSGAQGIPVDTLEEWNGDTLLLTYEIFSEQRVEALHSHYDVTLIGTNYTYPYVMRLPVISGGFFTEAAQERESRSVVLNCAAAFELFGSLDVHGREVVWKQSAYTVTGVVDDQSENSNVYLPASFLNESVVSLLSGADASDMEVRNAYQKMGIDDTRYTLVNLSAVREAIREKGICTLALCLSVGLILVLVRSLRVCIRSFHQVKAFSVDLYINEIIKTHPKVLYHASLACLVAVLCAATLLLLSVNVFEMMLGWEDYGQLLADIPEQLFAGKIHELYLMTIWSDILLITFPAGLGFVVILKMTRTS